MAAPSYTSDLTDVWVGGSIASWSALGGGASGLNQETDYFIQGSDCVTKNAWASALKGMIYSVGSGITIPADGAIIMYMAHATMNSVDTKANGGLRIVVGNSTSAYYHFYTGGSDTVVFGLWNPVVCDPNVSAARDATTGSPSGTWSYCGGMANLPSGGPTKGSPFAMDAVRYGRCRMDVTDGDLANGYATLAGLEAVANSLSNRWGLLANISGVYFFQGYLSMGTASTAVDWRDSNREIKILDTDRVSPAFNKIEVLNASSNVEWTNYSLRALGTASPCSFDVTAGTFTGSACQFVNMGVFTFASGTDVSISDSIFRGCDQVICNAAAVLTNCVITGSTAVADEGCLVWDVNSDPNGELDGVSITKGSAAHHAIEFGTNSPITVTLTDVDVSGFNASNGQNDSALYFQDRGTDTNWTVNRSGGTGTFSFKAARSGDTVTVVSSVSITLTGLQTNSEVRLFLGTPEAAGSATELSGVENSGDSETLSFDGSNSGSSGYIQVISVGYENETIRFPAGSGGLPASNQTIPVSQRRDRSFKNP